MGHFSYETLSIIFGILGNIISFFVFLAPMPTFYKIYKRKSSAGYPSLPYIIALFSASLLLYYGVLKTRAYLLIAINALGGGIELSYLFIYILYAPKRCKIIGLVLAFDIGCMGAILVFSLTLAQGKKRVTVVGWMCAVINIAVFAAPLTIMRKVIMTKSVEFMPVVLSFSLTANAAMWFLYGFYIRDYYIALPNVFGIVFGIVQIGLYFMYRNAKPTHMNGEKEKGDIQEIFKVDAEKDVEISMGMGRNQAT